MTRTRPTITLLYAAAVAHPTAVRAFTATTLLHHERPTISAPTRIAGTPSRSVHRDAQGSARRMTSAYTGEPGDGTAGLSELAYLPHRTTLPDGRSVEVGPFLESEWAAGMSLMNLIIQEGKSWPFEEEFGTVDEYRAYFLSHAAFVVRAIDAGVGADGTTKSPPGDVLGCFYVKPNYPGRCSHICNGGFITAPHYRRRGVARLMGRAFLRVARDLGYKSAYFNLVFKSNEASVALWEVLGFQRVAVLENAAKLKGVDGLDTAYGYRYDLESLDRGFFLKGSS